ncbi:MAG: hypothetical protein ACK559_38000, partial [bacterium]
PGSIPGRCSSIFGIWREDRLILCTLYIPVECSEEGLGYSDIYYIPVDDGRDQVLGLTTGI